MLMKKTFPILFACGALLLLAGCISVKVNDDPIAAGYSGTSIGIPTAEGLWMVEYGTSGDWLTFAVVSGPTPVEAVSHVHAWRNFLGPLHVNVRKPDGTEMPVQGTSRVYFVTDKDVIATPGPVSAKAFLAFLASKPVDYSLPTLLAFINSQK